MMLDQVLQAYLLALSADPVVLGPSPVAASLAASCPTPSRSPGHTESIDQSNMHVSDVWRGPLTA